MKVGVRQFQSFESTPEYAPLRAALASNRWEPVEAELARMPFDQVTYALLSLGDTEGIEGFLEYAASNHPQSPYSRTAMAARCIAVGWNARSDSNSSDVSQEQFAVFRQWIDTAEQWLISVCAEYPGFAPAWSYRVLTARALQVGESEARRRYRRLAELSPSDYPAQAQMLQYLLPKWFGSWDAGLAFARDCTRDAPAGSNSPAVLALFHIEQWISLGGGKPGKAYIGAPDVYNELQDAARRSVLHPSHRLDPIGVEARSTFAMAFYTGGHYADAAVHIQALGERATSFPWSYAAPTVDDLNRIYRLVFDGATKGRR